MSNHYGDVMAEKAKLAANELMRDLAVGMTPDRIRQALVVAFLQGATARNADIKNELAIIEAALAAKEGQ